MASSDDKSNGHSGSSSSAARAVPGSYGLPVIGNLLDRHDFYYRQGQDKYFASRIERYGSTVLSINVPRGPIFSIDPRVVALLDSKSFATLFDVSKVEKKDVLVGYVPPLSLTGGYRILSYLDPSEPDHAKLKRLVFGLLHSRVNDVVPAFRANFMALLDGVDSKIAAGGAVDFNKLNDVAAFQFLGEAFFGGARPAPELASSAGKWLLLMLSPLFTIGLPWYVEEPLVHSVPLPTLLVRKDYKAFYDYVYGAASQALDQAESLGFSREEACHNLVFVMGLNSYAAFKLMFPTILGSVAGAKSLHARLAAEVRAAVAETGGGKVTLAAVDRMELVKSVVWEAVRLDPPVKYQYGHAKADMEVESHDGVKYAVKKGQMLMGYQPCATRDTRVFGPTAREFVGDRFVGEEGRKLIKYVYWSNGPETEEPTLGNKQCPGKDFVMLVGRLFVVELFLRYDTFSVQFTRGPGGNKVAFTDVTKATS